MNPFQRVTRLGLAELDELAEGIAEPDVAVLGDADEVWAAAEAHRAALPDALRSALGIFYTPPAVADRLLDDLAAAGARFDGTMTFCDPACGGGAFLLPIARRVASRLRDNGAPVGDLARCLVGMDIDPGGLAITRSALDALAVTCFGKTSEWDLRQANVLRLAAREGLPAADVVVGNPPFGRVRLSERERAFFARSLKGHANLYGLFVDVALRVSGGLVGFVMPTSILCGDYFSALRELVSRERPLSSLRFVGSRTAVFESVLQETCLGVFGGSPGGGEATVFGDLSGNKSWPARLSGGAPWLIARTAEDAELLATASRSPYRLSDYGFAVHTGPLVWNRHRRQLRSRSSSGTLPIVWSDAVRGGEPVDFMSSRRPHLHLSIEGMGHLVVERPSVLVKRTTAKEQARRIVAAPFVSPPAVVENHLNVVTAGRNGCPQVTVEALAILLNSEPIDRLFRSLSGTVAVSATELAALPLPAPKALLSSLHAGDRDSSILLAYERTA